MLACGRKGLFVNFLHILETTDPISKNNSLYYLWFIFVILTLQEIWDSFKAAFKAKGREVLIVSFYAVSEFSRECAKNWKLCLFTFSLAHLLAFGTGDSLIIYEHSFKTSETIF